MIRSRKAESNVLAEIMMVGIAVALSTVVFFALRGDGTAGSFGSLTSTFEAPSEILSINGLSQKCPGTDASVAVKNTGGLDANVKAVAINDASTNANVNAKYPSTATSFSIASGSTSDPVDKSRCNDGSYLNIASAFSGTITNVVSNPNFNSNITGWTSSSSSGGVTSLKYYLSKTVTTGFGSDYRELKLTPDTPDSSTIISFGDKKDKHFLFKAGVDNSSTISNEHNSTPKGFGWRTVNAFSAVTASGTWNFGLRLQAINLHDSDGHIECEIYSANPDGSQAVRLFFLHPNNINVIDEDNDGQTINYVFTYTPGSPINLDGKILLYECYLDVNDNKSHSDADLIMTIDANAYIEIPLSYTITIDGVVHDPLNGNPSPGSGPGSAKGVITDLSTMLAIGTVDYNFIYQFTTPAQFNGISASYAWSYTELLPVTDTRLNFVRLIITDLNGNLITQLHCDDNGAGTCDGTAGWGDSVPFTYRTGITSTYALNTQTNYRLVVQFEVKNELPLETSTLTLRIDDVNLQFSNGNYQASATFNGTSDPTLNPSNIKLYFDSTFTQPGVSVTLQGYDYTISNYSTTTGQQSYAFATPNSDYITSMDLAPSNFLQINSGNWQVKVTATHTVSFTMSIDLLQLNAISNKPVLREVVYPQNIVISPGQTVLVNATLSRTLDADTSYNVRIVTERNSYSTVILN